MEAEEDHRKWVSRERVATILAVAFGLLFLVAMGAAAYSSISRTGRKPALIGGTAAHRAPTPSADIVPIKSSPSPSSSGCVSSTGVPADACIQECLRQTPPPGQARVCPWMGQTTPTPGSTCAGNCATTPCTAADVDVHAWTDRNSYAPGQPVWIYQYTRNHSAHSCAVPYNSCSDAITITQDSDGSVVYNQNPPARGVPCFVKPIPLKPGESTGTSGLSWNQQTGCYGAPGGPAPCTSRQSPPGTYTVHVRGVVTLTPTFALTAQ